ncbi:MAG: hypothetical protein LUC30_05085 [Clostridiales bacterium]|nr:hypothetical protein [Clostridiales bacterium]
MEDKASSSVSRMLKEISAQASIVTIDAALKLIDDAPDGDLDYVTIGLQYMKLKWSKEMAKLHQDRKEANNHGNCKDP